MFYSSCAAQESLESACLIPTLLLSYGHTDMASDPDQEYIYLKGSERLPPTSTVLSTNTIYPLRYELAGCNKNYQKIKSSVNCMQLLKR